MGDKEISGLIGKDLLGEKISAVKLAPPLVVETGTPVGEVVEAIQKHEVGYVLVSAQKKLIGIMTERDILLKIVARHVDYSEPVDNFMTPDPETLPNDATLGEAVTLMSEKDFRHVPIVDKSTGEAVAIFSIRYVIDYLAESFPAQVINLPPRPHQTMTTQEGG